MDPANNKTIEALVRALEKVSDIIKSRNPDCIVAPMMGAVPFVDMLNIIDEEFPNHKVEFVPASNKIYRLKDVLRGCFTNLIENYAPQGGSFLSLDEVVSGNSLVRVYKQFGAARDEYAARKTKETYGERADFRREEVGAFQQSIRDGIQYNTIGIVDPKLQRLGKEMTPEYRALQSQGTVIPVETEGIVTMDRTGFFPARYIHTKDSQKRTVFLPVVDSFNVSSEYREF